MQHLLCKDATYITWFTIFTCWSIPTSLDVIVFWQKAIIWINIQIWWYFLIFWWSRSHLCKHSCRKSSCSLLPWVGNFLWNFKGFYVDDQKGRLQLSASLIFSTWWQIKVVYTDPALNQRPKKSQLSGRQTITRKNFPDAPRKSFLRHISQKCINCFRDINAKSCFCKK